MDPWVAELTRPWRWAGVDLGTAGGLGGRPGRDYLGKIYDTMELSQSQRCQSDAMQISGAMLRSVVVVVVVTELSPQPAIVAPARCSFYSHVHPRSINAIKAVNAVNAITPQPPCLCAVPGHLVSARLEPCVTVSLPFFDSRYKHSTVQPRAPAACFAQPSIVFVSSRRRRRCRCLAPKQLAWAKPFGRLGRSSRLDCLEMCTCCLLAAQVHMAFHFPQWGYGLLHGQPWELGLLNVSFPDAGRVSPTVQSSPCVVGSKSTVRVPWLRKSPQTKYLCFRGTLEAHHNGMHAVASPIQAQAFRRSARPGTRRP
ncbi:hypothetical protein T440DRAFT_53846 [Plenodomus tracheiphilus IPT5]|uniref:Uncharacterized protein n=1 Tax=Plenodomus tracheiphilus IPT5 TaxID=1408161 RepID=A0A6A7BA41_9PLEO|nr:hypothetical protein T440DRAFT_53846 [Plenodomus tracheiphilus IPT5]